MLKKHYGILIGAGFFDKDKDKLVADTVTAQPMKPKAWPELVEGIGSDEIDLEKVEDVDEPDWVPPSFIRAGWTVGIPHVPTVDSDLDDDRTRPQSYPAWKPGETFVISGPCGAYVAKEGLRRGRQFRLRRDAREFYRQVYGAVLEEYFIALGYCFRVPTPGGPHDKFKALRGTEEDPIKLLREYDLRHQKHV